MNSLYPNLDIEMEKRESEARPGVHALHVGKEAGNSHGRALRLQVEDKDRQPFER